MSRGAGHNVRSMNRARAEAEAMLAAHKAGVLPADNKPKTSPRHIEDNHQASYFGWVLLMAIQDERYNLIVAVPNGGRRNKMEAARLKKQGVRAGYPDIIVDSPSPFYVGLRIELKRPIVTGEAKPVVSPEQKNWLTRLQRAGYVCCVCYGVDQAIAATQAYMAGSPVPHQWEQKP